MKYQNEEIIKAGIKGYNLKKIESFEIIQTNDWPEYDLKITLKFFSSCEFLNMSDNSSTAFF